VKAEALARWWVPSAIWSPAARTHLRWLARESRADAADRRGEAFTFRHPLAGRLVYHPGDYLTRRIFLYDNFERAELRYAAARAAEGGVIVDAGANIGLYTVVCARAAGRRGRVIALEPGQTTFAKLSRTCTRLGLSNVTLLPVAAGEAEGVARLVDLGRGLDVQRHIARAGDDSPGIAVTIRRLDDVCGADADAVTFMKLDVEGHELAALRGAARILANGRAHVIVEFNPSALARYLGSPRELWQLLSSTHACTAAYDGDGAETPATLEGVAAAAPDGAFNTIWRPRGSP
jgi:FkbM family methyltransferase